MHKAASKKATFRFYEELNDFLLRKQKKVSFDVSFTDKPSVKDVIESLGVPHSEIDLILVNARSVDFNYALQDGDQIAVYPTFESMDISPVIQLREIPLRDPKFVLDVHLGKLAKYLRLLGFDVVYDTIRQDYEIIQQSIQEKRCILTRDINLLKHKAVTRGYWVRATDPFEQANEILRRFDLVSRVRAFTRCLKCNDILVQTDKAVLMDRLEQKTKNYYQDFLTCPSCQRIYWKGSHYQKMNTFISRLIHE